MNQYDSYEQIYDIVESEYSEQLDGDRELEGLKPYFNMDSKLNSNDSFDERMEYITDWVCNFEYVGLHIDNELMANDYDPFFHTKEEVRKYYRD